MALRNRLGITDDIELAREEERLTKRRALEAIDASYRYEGYGAYMAADLVR